MTKEQIDILWTEALEKALQDKDYIRYHFAKLVAQQEREECASICEALKHPDATELYNAAFKTCAFTLRNKR